MRCTNDVKFIERTGVAGVKILKIFKCSTALFCHGFKSGSFSSKVYRNKRSFRRLSLGILKRF